MPCPKPVWKFSSSPVRPAEVFRAGKTPVPIDRGPRAGMAGADAMADRSQAVAARRLANRDLARPAAVLDSAPVVRVARAQDQVDLAVRDSAQVVAVPALVRAVRARDRVALAVQDSDPVAADRAPVRADLVVRDPVLVARGDLGLAHKAPRALEVLEVLVAVVRDRLALEVSAVDLVPMVQDRDPVAWADRGPGINGTGRNHRDVREVRRKPDVDAVGTSGVRNLAAVATMTGRSSSLRRWNDSRNHCCTRFVRCAANSATVPITNREVPRQLAGMNVPADQNPMYAVPAAPDLTIAAVHCQADPRDVDRVSADRAGVALMGGAPTGMALMAEDRG